MSNRIKFLGLGAIFALTVAIVWTATTTPGTQDGPGASASPTANRPSPTPDLPPEPVAVTYLDGVLGAGGPPSPTDHKAQSKLWVAEGAWWAVMFEPRSRTYHIYELVDHGKSWRDTGTVVDERPNAQPDCLWDATAKKLYIVSATPSKSTSGAARLIRYGFDAVSRTFKLEPNFPIRITDVGVDSMVLVRDTTGKLWTTYIADDGQVKVNRSTESDLLWGQPFDLPAPGSLVTADDVADIVAFGPGRVGVMWSSRGAGAFYLSSHEDGDPDATWSPPETAISGRGMANGELNAVASADGRLFATVKTALDADPSSSSRSPQILLLERQPDATWTSTLFGRIVDQHTSPLIAVDGSAGIVYAMATTPKRGGSIIFKRARAGSASFPSGPGSPLVADPTATATGAGSTTKDAVGHDTGLVVLAYDPDTTRYLHGVIDLGGGIAAGPSGPTPTGPQLVFQDDFDPWPTGPVPNIGWELRPTDPAKAFTIRKLPSGKTNTASLAASTPGLDVRACKSFPAVSSGDVTVDLKVRLSRIGGSDGVLTEVRGGSVTSASIRVGRVGTFAYYRGPTKIKTTVRFRAGAWYRSIVVVHVAGRTYDWRLLDAAGRQLIVVKGIAWRDPGKVAPDQVCLRTPTGGKGIALDWDDVRVIR
jgi:hypothetical protein